MSVRFAVRHPITWATCNWFSIALHCAVKGHDYRGQVMRTWSYSKKALEFTYLSVCAHCGDFGGWHHHAKNAVEEPRTDCWICQRNGDAE